MVREQWVRKLVILAPRCAGEPCQNFFRQRSSLACDAEWCEAEALSWPMAARNFNNKNHNLLCCSKHILLLLFISTIWTIHTTKNEWVRLKRCKLAKTIDNSLFPGGPVVKCPVFNHPNKKSMSRWMQRQGGYCLIQEQIIAGSAVAYSIWSF